MIVAFALLGLFVAAFIAATLIPFQSEAIFVALQVTEVASVATLVIVASIANTLGAFVNYWVGARAEQFRDHRWFPMTPEKLDRATVWFARWGKWSLLLSWMPLVELTTVVAGTLRTPLWQFALLVGVAKTARYVALAVITASAVQIVT